MKLGNFISGIESLGKALMLPIAILPIAGLLLRLGQPDLFNIPSIAAAGEVLFTNLPMIFALGVAVGFAKENNGTSAIAGLIGYLVMTTVLKKVSGVDNLDTGVLGGVLIGAVAGGLYNRFYTIQLPSYLAFFGGKRFVPIVTGLSALCLGVILAYVWPPIQAAIYVFGNALLDSGGIGVFIYGVINRILLVTGLHHILNNLVWFVFGNFTLSDGTIVHGDIARFVNGDVTAGRFMSGFFPVMMFGLPAACLAMYNTSLPENKKLVGGLLLSMALTSFLTGVTEPIEFAFLFLSPFLYLIHAILTGLSMLVMYYLNVHMGFTFSAGLIDYLLFWGRAQHPIYLLPVGIIYFAVYYFLFVFFIKKFNLMTIGRESTLKDIVTNKNNGVKLDAGSASEFVEALGGAGNIINVGSCTTRLRLTVVDSQKTNIVKLSGLGAYNTLILGKDVLQVIVGPKAELLAELINKQLDLANSLLPMNTKITNIVNSDSNKELNLIIDLLGGIANIKNVELNAMTRVRIEVVNSKLVKANELMSLKSLMLNIIDISKNIKQIYCGEFASIVYSSIITKL